MSAQAVDRCISLKIAMKTGKGTRTAKRSNPSVFAGFSNGCGNERLWT
jgi:hypothetical protein